MKRRKSFDEIMNEGGPVFWIVAALSALGFWGALWLVLAIGTMAGM